jgi:peptidoglycan LD-endopeptidase CwlK
MNINQKKFFIVFFISVMLITFQNNNNKKISNSLKSVGLSGSDSTIVDSDYSLQDALSGIKIPPDIKKILTIVDVYYYSFDSKLHKGQIVINKKLAKDIKSIFKIIKERKFPIKKVIPIFQFNWNDEASMKDNNTSAFNFRKVPGTQVLSYHATGRAIDINPKLNPQLKSGKIFPQGSTYNKNFPGTISDTSFIVKTFLKRGWRWGGNWKHLKDYQHFEK